MKKIKLARNILYVAGLIIFLSLIAYSLYHTNSMWVNELKWKAFSSFSEYYFTRAKGEILIAVIAGLIPILVGAFINAAYISKKQRSDQAL